MTADDSYLAYFHKRRLWIPGTLRIRNYNHRVGGTHSRFWLHEPPIATRHKSNPTLKAREGTRNSLDSGNVGKSWLIKCDVNAEVHTSCLASQLRNTAFEKRAGCRPCKCRDRQIPLSLKSCKQQNCRLCTEKAIFKATFATTLGTTHPNQKKQERRPTLCAAEWGCPSRTLNAPPHSWSIPGPSPLIDLSIQLILCRSKRHPPKLRPSGFDWKKTLSAEVDRIKLITLAFWGGGLIRDKS